MIGIFWNAFTRNTINIALVAVCFSTACSLPPSHNSSTTKIVTSWKDPTTTISSSQIKKILFIALVKDEPYSRMMEDHLVAVSNGKGIASQAITTGRTTSEADKALLDREIKSHQIDLVVIMRLKDVKEEPRYVPNTDTYGAYGVGYWDYYHYAAPIYRTPGFYTSDKHFLVETNVFSVAQNKLLWSGITDSVNPSYTTTERIAKAVLETMKKEGFLSE
jgi:hypothetical protein